MDGEKTYDGRNKGSSSSCSEFQNKNRKACLMEDAMFGILTRLPANYLLSSASYTCKSWADMISNSHFAETHLLHAKPGIFLQSISHPYGARFLEIKDSGEFEVTHFSPHFPGRLVNSCCGITLLCHYPSGALHVANPITMKAVKLPPLLGSRLMLAPCAIVRVPRTGEFKLFSSDLLTQPDTGFRNFYVLRLGKDDSWNKITQELGVVEFRCAPIYIGGNDLFWITENKVILMDVDKESFRQYPIPLGNHQWHSQYLKMGNCLSSIIYLGTQGFQIHTFDTELGTWTLYHEMRSFDYPTDGIEVLSEFFEMWIGKELIIKTVLIPSLTTILFTYNVKTGILKKIDVVEEGSFDVGLHTNSLLSWKSALP